MKNFEAVNSSNLKEAAYDEASRTMSVRFQNGTEYEYPETSKEDYEQFRATFQTEASSGKHFNQNFRGKTYRKV